jgi:hypothetical protein
MTAPVQRYFLKFDSMPMRLDAVSEDLLVEGEACIDIGRRSYHVEPFKVWCNGLNGYPFYTTVDQGPYWKKRDSGRRYTYSKEANPSAAIAIIDSQDLWHKEHDVRFKVKPTDEELVKLFEELQHTDNLRANPFSRILCGPGWDFPFMIFRDGVGMKCTIDDMRAAWARTLKKRVSASQKSISVQIDDGSADDV